MGSSSSLRSLHSFPEPNAHGSAPTCSQRAMSFARLHLTRARSAGSWKFIQYVSESGCNGEGGCGNNFMFFELHHDNINNPMMNIHYVFFAGFHQRNASPNNLKPGGSGRLVRAIMGVPINGTPRRILLVDRQLRHTEVSSPELDLIIVA